MWWSKTKYCICRNFHKFCVEKKCTKISTSWKFGGAESSEYGKKRIFQIWRVSNSDKLKDSQNTLCWSLLACKHYQIIVESENSMKHILFVIVLAFCLAFWCEDNESCLLSSPPLLVTADLASVYSCCYRLLPCIILVWHQLLKTASEHIKVQ